MPSFQFLRLVCILLAGDFDTRLDFSNCHRRQKNLIGGYFRNPIQDAFVRAGAAQF